MTAVNNLSAMSELLLIYTFYTVSQDILAAKALLNHALDRTSTLPLTSAIQDYPSWFSSMVTC